MLSGGTLGLCGTPFPDCPTRIDIRIAARVPAPAETVRPDTSGHLMKGSLSKAAELYDPLRSEATISTLVKVAPTHVAIRQRWYQSRVHDELKVYEIQLRFWEKGCRLRLRQVEAGLWEARASSRHVGGWATTVYGPTRLDAARWAWVTHRSGGSQAA